MLVMWKDDSGKLVTFEMYDVSQVVLMDTTVAACLPPHDYTLIVLTQAKFKDKNDAIDVFHEVCERWAGKSEGLFDVAQWLSEREVLS